jgi:hypothetical protein
MIESYNGFTTVDDHYYFILIDTWSSTSGCE